MRERGRGGGCCNPVESKIYTTNKFSQTYVTSEHMLRLVTLPGPMRVSGSAVVRVCVHHPCVTVPKRVTEAWEQNSSCQHAVTRGRERAQSPHTPAYRDL